MKPSKHDFVAAAISNRGNQYCEIREKKEHAIGNCFWNTRNLHYKLHLKYDNKKKPPKSDHRKIDVENENPVRRDEEHRACIERENTACIVNLASMILDFGTTNHMVNKVEKLADRKQFDARISSGDNSEIKRRILGYGKIRVLLKKLMQMFHKAMYSFPKNWICIYCLF